MKDMPLSAQEKLEGKEDILKTIDLDVLPHQLFELLFDDEVIEHLCYQSNLYALIKIT